MKKANQDRFFMAQVHHEVDEICSNGGTCRDLNSAIASRKESDAISSDSNLLNA